MTGQSLWKFDNNRLTLEYHDYEVDLEKCTTSAETLDWIIQVSGKTWATDQVLASLVRELARLLNPQVTMCSGGVEKGQST